MKRIALALLTLLAAPAAAREAGRGTPLTVQTASVAMDEAQLAGTRLVFLGAIAVTAAEPGLEGLTGLHWSADDNRFFAVSGTGRWFELATTEVGDRLVGLSAVRSGRLLDRQGVPATGDAADAEAVGSAGNAGWMVLIGRQHLLLTFTHLDAKPGAATLEADSDFLSTATPYASPTLRTHQRPQPLSLKALEPLAPGEEPSAFGRTASVLVCARRSAEHAKNCVTIERDVTSPIAISAEMPLTDAVPTDISGDLILLQSPGATSRVAIVQRGSPNRTVAMFTPPDNLELEGLTIRDNAGHRYLYLVSDSRRMPATPTTFLKFELLTRPQKHR